MAKWYQIANMDLPKALPKILAIPTAKLGAPPVLANKLLSPISCASWFICSTVTANPQLLILAIASTASLPTTPAGLLIAKNTPGSNTVAAIIAIIATKLSSNIAPYPIMRISRSLPSSLGVVPDEISAWNPEMAPQAMVINTNGNNLPPKIGPVPSVNWVRAGMWICGCKITMAMASKTTVPNLTKVDK